jgi:hypothetical protein
MAPVACTTRPRPYQTYGKSGGWKLGLRIHFSVSVLKNEIRRTVLWGALGASVVDNGVADGSCPHQLLLVVRIREEVDAWRVGGYGGTSAGVMAVPSRGLG